MKQILALAGGAAALALALIGNRLIWTALHGRGTAWLVPIQEELVKTGMGILVGQVFWVHGLFGVGEALSELARGKHAAGALALISHAIFGGLTVFPWPGGFPLPGIGWAAATLAHIGWNRMVLMHSREPRVTGRE